MNVLKRQALSTPFHQYDDVWGWGLHNEVKERGGGNAGNIVDEEQLHLGKILDLAFLESAYGLFILFFLNCLGH